MSILSLIKKFSLPFSLVLGAVVYLLFANIPILIPIGDAVGPLAIDMMPVVLFTLLYVTFCKIDIKEMKPQWWHFILQAIRTTLSALLVVIILMTDDATTKLILEGVFICVICPTATAVAVISEKLGGSIGSLTTFTIIANIVTMIIIPTFFPMVEKAADITFFSTSMMVLRNVTSVLVVPLALALLSRKYIPKFVEKIKNIKNLGFYLWCFNLTLVTGETLKNIFHSSVSGWVLAALIILPLIVCIIQFSIGKTVGSHFGDRISAGQALGQKNTVVGIWLTLTFLNPLAAVAPGAYVLWQNLVNSWQLWCKEKFGKLKW